MKSLRFARNLLTSLRRSFARFPVTLISSFLLLVLLIRHNETFRTVTPEISNQMVRLNMTVGLFVFLSLCLGLLLENYRPGDKRAALAVYAAGIALALLYRAFFLTNLNTVVGIRYVAVLLFLAIAFFYFPRLGRRDNFEEYVLTVLNAFATTVIYSAVLYFGIAAILFTTGTLFELDIAGKCYLYSFLAVVLLFALSLFLSRLPGWDETFGTFIYPKPLQILLIAIVIPLVAVYTAILYAYFAKILLTHKWPSGLVSHLVLWYAAVSAGVIFLLASVPGENKLGKTFQSWFPKLVLPLLAMLFFSIGLRVNQYGFTENRYYVVLLGIWVTLVMLYFSLAKPLRNIFLPVTLSLFILISAFGPLSAFAVSAASQNNRFANILARNEMLAGNTIVPKPDLNAADKREIGNILLYFQRTHGLGQLAVLPDGFTIADMEDVFGFTLQPQAMPSPVQYYYYSLSAPWPPLSVSDFDYCFTVSAWTVENRAIDQYCLDYDPATSRLVLSEADTAVLTVDIAPLALDVHARNNAQYLESGKGTLSPADLTFRGETDRFRYAVLFTGITVLDGAAGLHPENVEFLFLLGCK